jgi:hypothetical protein
MPKKTKRLTHRERLLFKNLTKGMTLTDASVKAGYSPKNPWQSGYQAIERIRLNAPELLAKHGLDDDTMIEDYLKPLLKAEETKFFAHEGRVTDQRNVAALGIRHSALDTTFKVRGLYAQPQQNNTLNLRDVTFNVVYETRDKPKILDDASIHDSSS